MNVYQDITLKPTVEIPLYFLWTKVFEKIHLILAEQKNRNPSRRIAISFPEYTEEELGKKLRIFADTREDLESCHITQALQRLQDYTHMTNIRPVPTGRIKGYTVYSRYQPDGSVASKARRYVKRHPDVSYAQAQHMLKQKEKKQHFPYIQLRSLSTGQTFSLFIQKKPAASPVSGTFGTYGFSHIATVPEF